MKLHAHKFVRDFCDGSRVVARLRKSRRLDMRWIRLPRTHGILKRPSNEFLAEYRTWREKLLTTLHPGKKILVVEL